MRAGASVFRQGRGAAGAHARHRGVATMVSYAQLRDAKADAWTVAANDCMTMAKYAASADVTIAQDVTAVVNEQWPAGAGNIPRGAMEAPAARMGWAAARLQCRGTRRARLAAT